MFFSGVMLLQSAHLKDVGRRRPKEMRMSNGIWGVALIVFLAGLSVSEVTFAGGGHRGGGHSGSQQASGQWEHNNRTFDQVS